MKGRGKVPMNQVKHPRILSMNMTNDSWYSALHPLHTDGVPDLIDGKSNAGVGPGLDFAQALVEKDSTALIALIPCAKGGAWIDLWQPETEFYEATVRRAKKAMQDFPADVKVNIKAVLWLQGESDAKEGRYQLYESKLKEMANSLRVDLDSPDLPFISATIGTFIEAKSHNFPYYKEINSSLLNAGNVIGNYRCVDALDLSGNIGDNVHYNTASQQELGKRYAQVYFDMIDGNLSCKAKKPYRTPKMQTGKPEAGKRVKVIPSGYEDTNVYHSLYLPEGHTKGKKYPVIVEYTGNYAPHLGSSGQVKDGHMGYANAKALGAIWVVMPYLSTDGRSNEITWWGSETKTIDYCAKQLKEICLNYGGDPSSVFIIGFSRGAIAVNRIGLNNDRAADIWLGFHSHDHFDGQKKWCTDWANNCDYEAYKADAIERAKRYKGRAALVGGQHMDKLASYLSSNEIDTFGKLTVLSVPITEIIPENDLFVHPEKGQKITHTDKWMNYESPEADQVINWYRTVIKNKPGTFSISGTVSDSQGNRVSGVMVETGLKGVDYNGIYTHFSITDHNGFYKLEGLTKGKRILMLREQQKGNLLKSKGVSLNNDKIVKFSIK